MEDLMDPISIIGIILYIIALVLALTIYSPPEDLGLRVVNGYRVRFSIYPAVLLLFVIFPWMSSYLKRETTRILALIGLVLCPVLAMLEVKKMQMVADFWRALFETVKF
ncbi:hypothetical protein JN531_014765 [Flagellatimonas centrodinii]|uniref:hypothetical protein n=1 Tax=Flagellatimonas centrodinii TaxID=2806210 RepID=UPI001FEEC0A7|nr:hypothetical protein [Flagellatimonas centrodinii]ULQ46350.1 hypothetical protein JN531_014765 [Flagellatimonas centrodinii]